jgi:hypothetical protein
MCHISKRHFLFILKQDTPAWLTGSNSRFTILSRLYLLMEDYLREGGIILIWRWKTKSREAERKSSYQIKMTKVFTLPVFSATSYNSLTNVILEIITSSHEALCPECFADAVLHQIHWIPRNLALLNFLEKKILYSRLEACYIFNSTRMSLQKRLNKWRPKFVLRIQLIFIPLWLQPTSVCKL